MYGGFEVFKIWLAVKLHFTTKTYDYFQYGGKVNLQNEMIDTSFINSLKNMTLTKHLISLLRTSWLVIKRGLEILPSKMVPITMFLIELIKIVLVIILGVSVGLLGILWIITTLSLMICFWLIEANIHHFSNFSHLKELAIRLFAYLKTSLISLKNGIKRLWKA